MLLILDSGIDVGPMFINTDESCKDETRVCGYSHTDESCKDKTRACEYN